jgi:predicted NBD/HSP70 family sugar kinase
MLMKASTETLRKQNRALVLSTLRELETVSHTQIAEWSGLSSSTVSSITTELEQENVLIRQEHAPVAGRGRPRVQFLHNPACAFVAAIRITFDYVEYSLVDYSGVLKDRFVIKRDFTEENVETFVAYFIEGLERLGERSGLQPKDILTISITSKGLVSRGAPVLLWSPVFEDARIDFEEILRPKWQGKISLTNETRFAAQAIALTGQKTRSRYSYGDFATLSLSHSIGLGIAGDDGSGKIRSFAPPFGHMVHIPDGPLCRCGSRGCIEAYSGFYGILRNAFRVTSDAIPAKFIPIQEMEKIAQSAREGNRQAEYAFRVAGEVLGIGLSRLHSFLGTMPVTIIGEGTQFIDLLMPGIETHIKKNLQVRFDSMPPLTVGEDEAELIFQGNVQASLADLDGNVIADRKYSTGRN